MSEGEIKKMSREHKCPVCGEYTFEEDDSHDVCEVCYWEDCGVQEDEPDFEGGANDMSLNQAREYWQKHKKPLNTAA